MRTAGWMTVLALTASILWGGACREDDRGEGGLEIGEDTLRIDVDDEDLEEAGREAGETIEGALEKGERAVGRAMEETGQALEGAADETGAAVDRALEKTGETIERAGKEMQKDGSPDPADSL